MFAFIGWLLDSNWLFESLGFSADYIIHLCLRLIVSLFSGLFTFWLSPINSLWSRKHEYEADTFAKNALSGPSSLKSALRKLYNENLGNLFPHPFYSAFYYSHPTLLERESSLMKD